MTARAAFLALALLAGRADAMPPELAGRVEATAPAGCADYRFLLLPLYRGELWTDAAVPPGAAFGLSLTYRRAFGSDDLVATSIAEMARMSGRPEAGFAGARRELENAMPSVAAGDRITAWRNDAGAVEFYHNGTFAGSLTHDADLFLGIWLGPGSRDPARRAALLSGRCDG